MLDKYGLDSEGLYEKLRDEIRESPLFRFDWFFLSRTPQELSRRCATLVTTVTREMEGGGPANGKENKRVVDEVEDEEEEREAFCEEGQSQWWCCQGMSCNLLVLLTYLLT